MSHSRWEERLEQLLDGELPQAEARLVREHLEGCAACRVRFDQLTRLSQSIRGLPREPMPEDLKATLLRREAGPSPTRPSRLVWRRTWAISSLAGAAIVAIVAVTVFRVPAPSQRFDNVAPTAPPRVELGTSLKQEAPADDADKNAKIPAEPRRSRSELRPEDRMRRDEAAARPPAAPVPLTAKDEEASEAPQELKGGESVVARYTTALIVKDDGAATLAPILPRDELPADAVAGTAPQAQAFQDEGAGLRKTVPSPGMDTARTPVSRALADRRGPEAVLVFWVSVGADGRVRSVQPIGALTESPEVVDAVGSLLKGADLTSREAGRSMSAVIEVRLPAAGF